MKNIYVLLLFSAFTSKAQVPNAQWAKGFGGTGYDYGNAIAVDKNGNSYVTGKFSGIVDFDPGPGISTFTSGGGTDAYLAKFDANGNYKWAFRIGGVANDVGNSVTVDASGNILVTGAFGGFVDFDPSASAANITAMAYDDIFVAKYDSLGNYKWAINVRGSGYDYGYSVVTDKNRNVYIGGRFNNTADFDPSPTATVNITAVNNSVDACIAKYDSLGKYIWAKSMGGKSMDFANSISIDNSMNVYVTGSFQDTADFNPSVAVNNLISKGGDDIFIAKYNALGNFVFAYGMGGAGNDVSSSLAQDAAKNIYIAGRFADSTDFDPSILIAKKYSAGGTDMFLASYDSTGAYKWAHAFGTTSFDQANCVKENSGSVYFTGQFFGTIDFDPSAGVTNLMSTAQDIFLVSFNSLGNLNWAKNTGGSGTQEATAIACGPTNQVYLTGFFQTGANFDGIPLTPNGLYDVFVTKYIDGNITMEINENPASALVSVYPNPTSGSVFIKNDRSFQFTSIKVRNILGQLIKEIIPMDSYENEIEIEGENGVYFVEITSQGRKTVVFKIVKQ